MKRVLVTGAAGFVGSHTLLPLVEKGFEVHAVDLRRCPDSPAAVKWVSADLLDPGEIDSLMAGIRPTHLLHCAWYAEPKLYWKSEENFRWLEAGIALLRSFHAGGGKRVVMAGTCAEYDWSHGTCSELTTPCLPATTYGACKDILHQAVRVYCRESLLSYAWGRLFYLYGPREHPSRLLPTVIGALQRGETADCSHGMQLRDFLHVEDAASAFVSLLESEVTGPVNIASGSPVSVREVVLSAASLLGGAERVRFGAVAVPPDDPPLLVANVGRLTTEAGWRPRYDLTTGIEQTVHWWQQQCEKERSR